MRRLPIVLSLLLLLALTPAAAVAQAPGTLSYQGVLTDAAGLIVPDGDYSLTFRIYDVAAGGAALYSEAKPAVSIKRGGFSVELGLGAGGIGLAFDRTYFLGIQVGADPELAPRVRLTAAPYAMGLRLPFLQTLSNSSPLLELHNTGTGPDARFRKTLQVGHSGTNGTIELFRAGTTPAVASLGTGGQGAVLHLRDEAGSNHHVFEPDVNGTGGYLGVYRSATLQGFTVDGNRLGTGDPMVAIVGTDESALFDMSQSGNSSVSLPPNAISAVESLDEAGVASATQPLTTDLTGAVQTLVSRSFTAPAAGYCLAIATAQVNIGHTNGATSTATFGVSEVASVFPTNQDIQLSVPASAASGTYVLPVTVHGLFQVTAGLNTIFFLGDEGSGDCSFADGQLSLVFLPTAYGTVTPTLIAESEDGLATTRGLSAAETAAERAGAERFHRERLEGEVGAMRAQMDVLRRQLEAVAAEQAAARGEGQQP